MVFRNATYNIEDILHNTKIKFVNGEKKSFEEDEIHNITTFEVFQSTLGRCFELTLELMDVAVVSVEFNANFPIYIYVNMPGQTTNENSKSKVEVKMKQRLFIDVTYEVFELNDEEKCFKYSQEYSYDNCNFNGLEKYFTNVGCSVPYVKSNVSVCKDKDLISKVFQIICLPLDNPLLKVINAFDNILGVVEPCKDPCVKTVTYFGFPFLSDDEELEFAYAKLYFKNVVKVTEDYLAYTFLR